ncbi:MAG: sodium:solute symporter [Pseudomonadota bacterium]
MSAIDWFVMIVYLLGMLLLAFWLGRRQQSAEDYFLGGQALPSSALAASTIATQCSTNSLLGAPAFVGFTVGGGLIWLQYELAVPLAMAALLWLLVPARRGGSASVYGILEAGLGRNARRLASACFLLFRGVATGVTIYGVSLVLALILDVPYALAVVLLMGVTLLYDLLGGLRAVVISDVIQLALLTLTVLVSLAFLVNDFGWAALFADRTTTLVNDWGVDGNSYGFWPMLIGGFFLYTAYYGCDQSQAQRVLAASTDEGSQRVLLLNGLCRFPLVLAYCLLGLGLAAFARANPAFIDALPLTAAGTPNFNLVFPRYVLDVFGPGFVGLVMVGLLAAAMSSIDSAINSLSAATMEDFVRPQRTAKGDAMDGSNALFWSRATTLFWGLFAVAFSFQVEQIAPTVLESINKIGSMANGPLLALFCLALLFKGVKERAAISAFLMAIAVNGAVAWLAPQVSWLWWNVIGFFVALGGAVLLQRVGGGEPLSSRGYVGPPLERQTRILALAALAIFGVCLALQRI